MIEEQAQVVQRDGDYVWVETQKQSTCGTCSLNKGCGTGIIATYFNNKTARIKIENAIGANIGDRVLIGLNESALMLGSFLVYLLPLLFVLIFAIFGELMANQLLIEAKEMVVIMSAVIGFLISIFFVRKLVKRSKGSNRFQPVLIKKLN